MNVSSLSILSYILHLNHLTLYENLVFVSSPNRSAPFEDCGRSLIQEVSTVAEVPVISLTYDSTGNLAGIFNQDLLVIVDLQSSQYPSIVENLATLLHCIAQTRILLIINQEAPKTDLHGFLWDIFETCWKRKLINVAAVFRDFSMTQNFFSYDPYPTFHLERKSSDVDEIFPDRVKDMKGAALKVFADQIEPTNMLTLKADGTLGLYGYAGHIINCFFQKHNAVMDFSLPFTVGESVLYMGLEELLFNDTVDLLISVPVLKNQAENFTNWVDQTAFCLMVPVEEKLPTREFYALIVHPPVLGLVIGTSIILSGLLVIATNRLHPRRSVGLNEILLNRSCLRGLLSQSFTAMRGSTSVMKFIYFLMSLMGLYFTTWYLSYLQAYLTHPPLRFKVEQRSDLLKVDYKVNFFLKEYLTVEELIHTEFHPSVYVVTESFTEYLRLVDVMDRRYAYSISKAKWKIFKGQQGLFSKPLFRTTKMCGLSGSQLAFPLHPNSVHKDALNWVILQLRDSGLLQHWMDRSFYELVEIGRMNFSDWTKPEQRWRALRVDDLSGVMVCVVGAHVSTVVVFVGEVILGRWRGSAERRRSPA